MLIFHGSHIRIAILWLMARHQNIFVVNFKFNLNGSFSSVFTKEDISSLPVADAKFKGAKSDYLGPLVVTPELVAKKIKAMKDNKSSGVDGIPPK